MLSTVAVRIVENTKSSFHISKEINIYMVVTFL